MWVYFLSDLDWGEVSFLLARWSLVYQQSRRPSNCIPCFAMLLLNSIPRVARIDGFIWGFLSMEVCPKKNIVCHGKYHLEMDDDWGYPYFREPPYHGKRFYRRKMSDFMLVSSKRRHSIRGPRDSPSIPANPRLKWAQPCVSHKPGPVINIAGKNSIFTEESWNSAVSQNGVIPQNE